MDTNQGNETRRTIILGGGITGLLAAWHLRRAGRAVEVWEAAATVGGWAQTLPWPGPKGEPGFLERGPQTLRFPRDGTLDRLLCDLDLDLDLRQPGPRGPRWLGKGGQRHPSPTTPAGLLRTPGLGGFDLLRLLAEPFIPPGHAPDESLRAFFARRLGEGFARELLPALVAGVLAAPPERIGLEALPRLQHLEARGGLLLGGWGTGHQRTRVPAGGVGTLAESLAARLGSIKTASPARALEPLPGGGWRLHGDGFSRIAPTVVLALPTSAAAALLRPTATVAADLLEAIPRLDLRVWHSRHRMVKGWERGIGLLLHPPEGRGLLGAASFSEDDPRGVPGLLQLRTYLGGAYPVDPALSDWNGVFGELRRWLPELGEAIQVREESCPAAFPLIEPGHGGRVAKIIEALPPNLHWLGAARFGPGIPDLADGVEEWARTAAISA